MCLAAILACLSVLANHATEHPVSNAQEIAAAAKIAKPGDEIVMAEGEWTDQKIVFEAQGEEARPIALRAKTPGKTIVTGVSTLTLAGRHLVVSDLLFKDGSHGPVPAKPPLAHERAVVSFKLDDERCATHTRLTRCEIRDWKSEAKYHVPWIYIAGHSEKNRVDHCRFSGQNHRGETIVVIPEEKPNRHRIDHNFFGKRERGGLREDVKANGHETIRIGGKDHNTFESYTLVEYNHFEECDGEDEMISNKSFCNIYRNNLFRNCIGELVLRGGERCVVENNRFENCRGGIRVNGTHHRIVGNVIIDARGAGIRLIAGWETHAVVTDCLIANNTIVNAQAQGILFADWLKGEVLRDGTVRDKGGTELPVRNKVVNNLIVGSKGVLIELKGSTDNVLSHNLLHATGEAQVGEAGSNAILADPKFANAAEHDYRLAEDSPARGAGMPLDEVSKAFPVGAEAAPFSAGPAAPGAGK
ncbi:MAG: polysaccharide lyase 6 family protein [Planctomycetota bacterium]|nr:polysaccharide lyase 6 family protein [Planctomycetota bacterium]